tara:strand:+ start:704 stop:1780 length:1077 start_codon:yes stop_codon:yes gene_type:complete
MANMNIRTPVFYPDRIRHLRGRGDTNQTIKTGSGFINFQSGSIGSLHNGKPLDLCSFDTTGDVDGHVLFKYNMGTGNWRTTFFTILNHNLVTSQGKIQIWFGDESNDVEGEGNADTVLSSVDVTEVLNAGTIAIENNSNIHIHPTADGTTIIKIVNTSDSSDFTGQRYMAVQFEGNASASSQTGNFDFNGSTDLTVGGIEIGEIYTMPVAPDLNVKRSIIYDNTTIQESLGGQKYANLSSFGRLASTASKSPFNTTSDFKKPMSGRIAYDMSFSYLQNTDVMPDEYNQIQFTDDSFVGDVWGITEGNFHPFVFSIDSTSLGSGAESEFIYARFAQNSLVMDQVAPDVFNIKLKIEEEF